MLTYSTSSEKMPVQFRAARFIFEGMIMGLPVQTKKLCKTDLTDDVLSGVCGGIALYLGVDSTVVRVITAVGALLTGFFPFVLVYLVLLFILPSELDV